MAEIFPFRALRYNPARVELTRVVTQPYDKITPALQARYYDASPYNLVRIILGRREPGDSEAGNVYTRAAEHFREWRREGVLLADAQPSIYLYIQKFAVPGDGGERERRGFIALGPVVPYTAGIVFRHEQTLAKPRADRLNLLRATRAHFGQIFVLYSDPEHRVDSLLASRREPDLCVRDDQGVQHALWQVADAEKIAAVQAAMAEKKLIIADGHHRYETALAYRDELAAAPLDKQAHAESAPYQRVMMTFVNMDAQGLIILPTHRVVFGLPGFDADLLLRSLWGYFHIESLPAGLEPGQLTARLGDAGRQGTAFVLVTRNDRYLLRSKGDGGLLDGISQRQRTLDLVRLHKIILEHVLGLSEDDIQQQRHIAYYRDVGEAIARVRNDGNAAFLVSPASIEQVRDIAFAGEVLPQKSTDFYPKMLSGLTIYALD